MREGGPPQMRAFCAGRSARHAPSPSPAWPSCSTIQTHRHEDLHQPGNLYRLPLGCQSCQPPEPRRHALQDSRIRLPGAPCCAGKLSPLLQQVQQLQPRQEAARREDRRALGPLLGVRALQLLGKAAAVGAHEAICGWTANRQSHKRAINTGGGQRQDRLLLEQDAALEKQH